MASMAKRALATGLLSSALANALRIKPRADDTVATVNIEQTTGTPQHLASGFIYGIPDAPDQIPDEFYTGIDFQYGRAGGAQLGEPARGWIWGLDEYKGRLNSTLSNYETCRKYDAKFLILPHDIWGTDHANASTVWPGDNGDWTDYDNFIDTLLSDLAAADALEGMVFEIWYFPLHFRCEKSVTDSEQERARSSGCILEPYPAAVDRFICPHPQDYSVSCCYSYLFVQVAQMLILRQCQPNI